MLFSIGIILVILAGICKAVMDTVADHYDNSVFASKEFDRYFWDKSISWANKYMNDMSRRPRFWGSTTVFVFVTDAWHLFQFCTYWMLIIGCGLMFCEWYTELALWQEFLLKLFAVKMLFHGSFEFWYSQFKIVE
jgi:hypothetical protein